jgi:hypothetical protein
VIPSDTANAFLAFIEKHGDCEGEILRVSAHSSDAGKRFHCVGCRAEFVLSPDGSAELARLESVNLAHQKGGA